MENAQVCGIGSSSVADFAADPKKSLNKSSFSETPHIAMRFAGCPTYLISVSLAELVGESHHYAEFCQARGATETPPRHSLAP